MRSANANIVAWNNTITASRPSSYAAFISSLLGRYNALMNCIFTELYVFGNPLLSFA
jgi:hypothetical protein